MSFFLKFSYDSVVISLLKRIKITNNLFIDYVLSIEECIEICDFMKKNKVFEHLEKTYGINLCRNHKKNIS